MQIEILERSIKYGYLFWLKEQDAEVRKFLGNHEKVYLVFEGDKLGIKKVDLKYRRISIGWRWTRRLTSKVKFFKVSFQNPPTLIVNCSD
jgi:hypothetical protein